MVWSIGGHNFYDERRKGCRQSGKESRKKGQGRRPLERLQKIHFERKRPRYGRWRHHRRSVQCDCHRVSQHLDEVCTWGVPGGIKGLVTVLPAANATQAGVPGIGQYFTDLKAATIAYAASQGVTITESSDTYVQWQNSLKNLYTLHGTTWTYNLSAVIDWGTFINAIISFIIIAITLFVIVRTVKSVKAKRLAWQAQIQEEYYKKHPEERPAPEPEPVKKPTTEELLTAILGELQAQNGAKKTEEAK